MAKTGRRRDRRRKRRGGKERDKWMGDEERESKKMGREMRKKHGEGRKEVTTRGNVTAEARLKWKWNKGR